MCVKYVEGACVVWYTYVVCSYVFDMSCVLYLWCVICGACVYSECVCVHICTHWTWLALLGHRLGGETHTVYWAGPGMQEVPWGQGEVPGELPRPSAGDGAKVL